MRKINKITSTANSNNEFTDGVVAAGVKPTILPAGWFNVIQRELVAVVEGAGLALDDNNDKQISEIIGRISSVVNHYRNYGYPLWENTIPYEEGTVVRRNGALYLSLTNNNRATPGTDASVWQPYVQREATRDEAILGVGSREVITPRRLHDGASYLDDQLKTTLTPYLLPIGATIMWPSETPPDGWLELNGQQFNVAENPKLAVMFPAGYVPDWRGRFPRAWDHGRGVDPGRELGSTQKGTLVGGYDDNDFNADVGLLPGGAKNWQGDTFNADDYGLEKVVWSGNSERKVYPAAQSEDWYTVTRPTNVATMFIVKTDQAESHAGDPVPTTIIVTPASGTINSGMTQNLTGLVLPEVLANDYPISWSVSDLSLGRINENGMYTSTAGMSGTQTIIASISTGLTTTVTLNQFVYLTNITIAVVPEIEEGNTYNLALSFTPLGHTEPVNYASSDNLTVSVVDGVVTAISAGSATISATGRYSGITASRPVTVTPKVVVEKYLQINKRLSEIAAAGATAQAAARNNLGLGGLATKDGLTATDVGAIPQASASLGTENLNTVIAPGRKFQSLTSNATLARNYPVALAGMLDVIKTTDAGIRQSFYPHNSTDVYHRYCVDVGANPIVFSTWGKSGGNFLEKSQNLLDVPDKPIARDNLGVGYTISTSEPPASGAGYAAGHIWYQVL